MTGAAGFIGFHLSLALIGRGVQVVGVDNLNSYYDPKLKEARLQAISCDANAELFEFQKADLADGKALEVIFDSVRPNSVIHLAAQAGVRHSLEKPHDYVQSNLVGFVNILECCREHKIEHLVYASSSSVYGMNTKQPFSAHDRVDHPVSLYAATKRSNELMAHTYSHLFSIPATGLRFFTVYGPYGRPDMAYYKFTKAILEGSPIDLFNNGTMMRDFTYIDDIVLGILGVLGAPPSMQKARDSQATAPHRIYNIGNNKPVTLAHFVETIENACDVKAIKRLLPMQPGDVPTTFADIEDLRHDINFSPSTPLEEGIDKFVKWYKSSNLELGK